MTTMTTTAATPTMNSSARLRLTQRGRIVIVLAVLVLSLLVAAIGAMRADAAPVGPPEGWSAVTVTPGDTLWQMASVANPTDDPRPLLAQIRQVNGLTSAGLVTGQQVWVPAASAVALR